jgi:hypothetical protein
VKKDSATFEYLDCRNMPLQRNHKRLNKFINRDTDYTKVLKAIKSCIEKTVRLSASKENIEGQLSSYHMKPN